MILAIYDWKFAEERVVPAYYKGMRVTVKVLDLETLKKIPAYFTFTVRNKEDFEMDECEIVADSACTIDDRHLVSGDIMRVTKRWYVERVVETPSLLNLREIALNDHESTFIKVVKYNSPMLDYLDKNFIQHFGRSDYFLPPKDKLDCAMTWGIYGDFLMDTSETYHIGEALNVLLNDEHYRANIQLLIDGRGPFRRCDVNPRYFDRASYNLETLKKYGAVLLTFNGTRQVIRFPNHFKYREWLKKEVTALKVNT